MQQKNILKIFMTVVIIAGLFYAYYTVLNSRFQGTESRKQMKETVSEILRTPTESKRLVCSSELYLNIEYEEDQEKIWDKDYAVEFIQDIKNERMQITRGNKIEILGYNEKQYDVYSKGISPVYSKKDACLKKAAADRWYHYNSEALYGLERKKAQNPRFSYGYLKSEDFLKKIRKPDKEKRNGAEWTVYTAIIKNTVRKQNSSGQEEHEFRRALSVYGLDALDLKKKYPEVYKLLQDTYNRDTEEMKIWVDEKGNLACIEKDYTFQYYADVMKENSEKIQAKVGQYAYPPVVCRQNYTYSPACKNIEMPNTFEEL